jgi:hypothetical protein
MGSIWAQWRPGVDPFSPGILVPALHLLRTSPYLFFVAQDPEGSMHYVVYGAFRDLDAAFLWYGFVELLGFACVMLGIKSRIGPRLAQRLPLLRYVVYPTAYHVGALGALTIGLAAYWALLSAVGGFRELVFNLDNRVELLEGLGYLMGLMSMSAVGVVMLTHYLKYDYSLPRVLGVIAATLACAAMLSSYGGRKLALSLIISVLLVWHYSVRPIRHPLRLALLLILLATPYFVAMPLVRSTRGALENYLNRPSELVADIVDNFGIVVSQLSYVDTYVYVTNAFTLDNIWLGKSFLDLIKAPIPRGLLPDKPAIDEGRYVRTMAEGMRVYPGMPADEQYVSAWPTETLGTMYFNFHLPGVVAGMFLLGVFFRLCYEYMLLSGKNLYSLIIYQAVMFNFQWSNLRLVQFFFTFGTVTAFFLLFMSAHLTFPAGDASRERSRSAAA